MTAVALITARRRKYQTQRREAGRVGRRTSLEGGGMANRFMVSRSLRERLGSEEITISGKAAIKSRSRSERPTFTIDRTPGRTRQNSPKP
jgi:hypothetical protein